MKVSKKRQCIPLFAPLVSRHTQVMVTLGQQGLFNYLHLWQSGKNPALQAAGHKFGEHSHGVPHPVSSEFSSPCTASAPGFEKGLGSYLLRTADPQDTLGPSVTREP